MCEAFSSALCQNWKYFEMKMTSSSDPISQDPAFPTGDCQCCVRAKSLQRSSEQPGQENIPVPAARQPWAFTSEGWGCTSFVPEQIPAEGWALESWHGVGYLLGAPQINPPRGRQCCCCSPPEPSHSAILQPGTRNMQSQAAPLRAAGHTGLQGPGSRERQRSPAHAFSKPQQHPQTVAFQGFELGCSFPSSAPFWHRTRARWNHRAGKGARAITLLCGTSPTALPLPQP